MHRIRSRFAQPTPQIKHCDNEETRKLVTSIIGRYYRPINGRSTTNPQTKPRLVISHEVIRVKICRTRGSKSLISGTIAGKCSLPVPFLFRFFFRREIFSSTVNRWPGKATPAEVLIREKFSDTSAETTRLSGATHPSLNPPYPTISFDEENDSPSLMTLDEFRLPSIKGKPTRFPPSLPSSVISPPPPSFPDNWSTKSTKLFNRFPCLSRFEILPSPSPRLTPLKTHQKDININFPLAREITIVTGPSHGSIFLPRIYRFSHASWIYHAIPVKLAGGEFKITPPPYVIFVSIDQ